jgi:SagB-type dehydrogenase family enzyme
MNRSTQKEVLWDYLQEEVISTEVLNDVLKFHQSSNFILSESGHYSPYTKKILNWSESTQYTDVEPNYILEEINLINSDLQFQGSYREFDNEYKISKFLLGSILNNAFGKSRISQTKKYPSAGALYPVFTLLYVFSDKAIEDVSEPGCYYYHPTHYKLIKLKSWKNNDDYKKACNSINPNGNLLSNVAIGYAVDFRRTVTKYRLRGYRHALIEVGLMIQSFKEELIKNTYGECVWSGFNDNQLTYNSGLNVRLSPVVMTQWFGKVKNL